MAKTESGPSFARINAIVCARCILSLTNFTFRLNFQLSLHTYSNFFRQLLQLDRTKRAAALAENMDDEDLSDGDEDFDPDLPVLVEITKNDVFMPSWKTMPNSKPSILNGIYKPASKNNKWIKCAGPPEVGEWGEAPPTRKGNGINLVHSHKRWRFQADQTFDWAETHGETDANELTKPTRWRVRSSKNEIMTISDLRVSQNFTRVSE